MERRLRQRIEMQNMHAQQMHFKALRVQAEKEEEEEFRRQVGRLSSITASLCPCTVCLRCLPGVHVAFDTACCSVLLHCLSVLFTLM